VGPRRPGDPPSLVADPARARDLLKWAPTTSTLDRIVADALRWERQPAYGAGRRAGERRSSEAAA
jgi:UDP-glucose 4-epimerase